MAILYPLIAPSMEPVSLNEAKAHCRVDTSFTDDDTLLRSLIIAARQFAEDRTNRQFVEAKWQMKMDGFPGSFLYQGGRQPNTEQDMIRPPHVPFSSLSSIQYLDTSGTTQTLAASKYIVDALSEPARISPAYAEVWPVTRVQMNAVTVTYFAGHLVSFTAVAATDIITTSGRNYSDGEKVRLSISEGGTLPGGLAVDTDYYTVSTSTNTLKLSLTSGGAAIDLTSAGSGTMYLGEVPRNAREAMLQCISAWYAMRGDQELTRAASLKDYVSPLTLVMLDQLWDGSIR